MSRKSDTTRRTKNMTCTVNLPLTHPPIPWKNILTEKYTRHMSTGGSRLVQTTCKTLNKNTNTYGWDQPAYFFEQYWTKHCLESGFSGSVLSFNLFDKVSGFWNYNNLALWRMSTHKWTEPGIQFAAYKKNEKHAVWTLNRKEERCVSTVIKTRHPHWMEPLVHAGRWRCHSAASSASLREHLPSSPKGPRPFWTGIQSEPFAGCLPTWWRRKCDTMQGVRKTKRERIMWHCLSFIAIWN